MKERVVQMPEDKHFRKRTATCKGPEARSYLVYGRDNEEAGMANAE